MVEVLPLQIKQLKATCFCIQLFFSDLQGEFLSSFFAAFPSTRLPATAESWNYHI